MTHDPSQLERFDPAPWLVAWAGSSEDYGLIFMTLEGTVVGANPAIERVLGYRPRELVGGSLRRIFTEADLASGLDRHEMEVARRLGRSEDDRWHIGKGGRRVWVNGVLSLVRDAGGEPFGLVKAFRDRSDHRMEVELTANSLEAACASLRRKDETLATVGHEARNPIAVIAQATAVLQAARRDIDSPNVDRALGLLERQTAILRRLVDDLREAESSSAAPLSLDLAGIVINDAVASVVESHKVEAARRGQHIEVVLPEPAVVLEADPVRLEQILGNLIGNAIKYTQDGGRIGVTATVEGRHIVMRVDDNGMGIDSKAMPEIFELFTREARAADLTEGLGVGLALVKRLVSRHGGSIEAQSGGPGMGSRFTVSLPLTQSARPASGGLAPDC